MPVYLARGLDNERVHSSIDTALRARHDQEIGLVLRAGKSAGVFLAANVPTPVLDHIEGDNSEIILDANSFRAVFRRSRTLARGGIAVQLDRTERNAGTLFVPATGTIAIAGENRLNLIERLVNAHNSGPAAMATEDFLQGMEGQSLANIFKQPLWNKLKAEFLRSPKKGSWEIAA